MVKICVTGCLHGELDRVYADIAVAEQRGQFKTDLVLCCGDFQALRNPNDLAAMSVPPKYYSMGDFWRYYSEENHASVLTLFVGGNHEASSYLQELPYGGWVAPNIWYMGYAGVVQFMGLRIAGLSGIYKQHDYTMGHYEHPPYSEATKRSVYHLRNLEVFRLGQIRRRLDIVLSHDWPRGIYHYGDVKQLVYQKPHFRSEIDSDTLGSPPGEQLFCHLKPRYWFAAHLHCKFAAVAEHYDSQKRTTRFLALDKCLQRRGYLQFIDIEPEFSSNTNMDQIWEELDQDYPIIVSHPKPNQAVDVPTANDGGNDEGNARDSPNLFLDPEWLCILKSTNHLMSTSKVPCILPDKETNERCDFSASNEEIKALFEPFGGEFAVPDNFERTAPVYKPADNMCTDLFDSTPRSLAQQMASSKKQQQIFSNPQTELLCAMLDLLNPNAVLLGKQSYSLHELSAQFGSKTVEEDEEEEEDTGNENETGDEEEEPEVNTSHVPHSWVSSVVTEEQSEYDPLDSSFMSPAIKSLDQNKNHAHLSDQLLSESMVSQNPEELLLETNSDDESEIGSLHT